LRTTPPEAAGDQNGFTGEEAKAIRALGACLSSSSSYRAAPAPVATKATVAPGCSCSQYHLQPKKEVTRRSRAITVEAPVLRSAVYISEVPVSLRRTYREPLRHSSRNLLTSAGLTLEVGRSFTRTWSSPVISSATRSRAKSWAGGAHSPSGSTSPAGIYRSLAAGIPSGRCPGDTGWEVVPAALVRLRLKDEVVHATRTGTS